MTTKIRKRNTAHVKVGRTFEFLGKVEQVCVDGDVHVILYPEEPQTHEYPGAPSTCELERFDSTLVTGYDETGRETYCYSREQKPDWFAALDRIMFRYIEERWGTLGKELHYDGATSLEEGNPDDDA